MDYFKARCLFIINTSYYNLPNDKKTIDYILSLKSNICWKTLNLCDEKWEELYNNSIICRQYLFGLYYGYPECCIQYFLKKRKIDCKPDINRFISGRKQDVDRFIYTQYIGYVPCDKCLDKYINNNYNSITEFFTIKRKVYPKIKKYNTKMVPTFLKKMKKIYESKRKQLFYNTMKESIPTDLIKLCFQYL